MIESPADIRVEGRVEGHIRSGGTVFIAANASCTALVEARCAEVVGEVIGDVFCTDSVIVAAGARVVGDVRAPDVSVDGAAQVEGRVDLLPPEPREASVRRLPLSASGVITPRAPARPNDPPGSGDEGTSPGSDFDEQPTEGFQVSHTPATADVYPASLRRAIPRPPRPRGRIRVHGRNDS